MESLLEDHLLYHLRQIHGILRLAEKYGPGRLNAACGRANAFGDPSYRTVKTILEKGLDQETALAAPVVAAGAFLRGPQELLLHVAWPEEVHHG